MKKLLKKAMVFTLAAAMLVGTPLTASAAPLNSVYSIWDGTGTWNGHDSGSGTGTVTNTDTNSGALIEENDAKIIGIVLDKQNLNLEKGDKEPLKATVVLDGKIEDADHNDITDDVIAEMSQKVKWEVLYLDENGKKDTSKGDPAAKVGLELNLGSNSDRSTVQLNAKQGTEEGKEVTVRATINAAYSYTNVKDENGQNTTAIGWDSERANIKYTAETTVYVKEYSEKLAFNGVKEEQLVKHTLDLNEYLVRTPATANDTITWSSSNTKIATVNAAGVVTFKKTTGENEKVTITAVGEKGAKAAQEFTVGAGVPASKVEVWSTGAEEKKITKLSLDLNGNEYADVDVKMYAKVDAVIGKDNKVATSDTAVEDLKQSGGKYVTKKVELANDVWYFKPSKDKKECDLVQLEITDNIAWTTNKATIATVEGGNEDAVITAAGKALGTAKITAKASSGKSANVSVTVKATLSSLEIGNAPTDLYSGQSVQLTADRTPALNKDAVKWSIKKIGSKNNPNATINSKGVLTIKPKLDLSTSDYGNEIVVVLETKTAKDTNGQKFHDEAKITLTQSSIDGFAVFDDANNEVARFETKYKTNGKVQYSKQTVKNKTTNISVPKGRTYTVTVDPAKDQDYAADGSTLLWKSSNEKIAKVVPDGDGNAKITAIAKGTATITVSGVRAENSDGKLKSAKIIKATFKVAVKQPTTSITIKTPSVVVKEAKNKNASVTFKATQNKNAKETLIWSVVKNGVKDDNAATVTNKGKVTLKKNNFAAGDVFTVTVKAAESGVTAKATIRVITPSVEVRVVDAEGEKFFYLQKKGSSSKTVNNATVLDLGGSVTLYPEVNVGKSKNDAIWRPADTLDTVDDVKKAAANVTYSVNKKGIVQIIGNTVYRVGNGTVKITVKTADGKKYTLTIDDKSKEYVPTSTPTE